MTGFESELWDLLHESAQFIPVSRKDLYDNVQATLDRVKLTDESGCSPEFHYKVQRWDGVQDKWLTVRLRCNEQEMLRLANRYKEEEVETRVLKIQEVYLDI